ncbi:MAG: hypothetical protein NTZ17_00300 [Phycisphaerae bacterium]|nr:hypothetical protein [Phycisphaerae bacterium]
MSRHSNLRILDILDAIDRIVSDVDGDSLRIYKDRQNRIQAALTFIDHHHNRWNGFPVVLSAVPGAKANAITFEGEWSAVMECLQAEPVGVFVVVGFKDSPKKQKT